MHGQYLADAVITAAVDVPNSCTGRPSREGSSHNRERCINIRSSSSFNTVVMALVTDMPSFESRIGRSVVNGRDRDRGRGRDRGRDRDRGRGRDRLG